MNYQNNSNENDIPDYVKKANERIQKECTGEFGDGLLALQIFLQEHIKAMGKSVDEIFKREDRMRNIFKKKEKYTIIYENKLSDWVEATITATSPEHAYNIFRNPLNNPFYYGTSIKALFCPDGSDWYKRFKADKKSQKASLKKKIDEAPIYEN